ncbi:DUF2271 domain-containing protein [Colwellia demingiae]|uniref:DUF2271 domain-containing protein n=1 Tax=Colwellia demingiae TaxID=89401 RepID=A0A5C6QSS4_9GAMM|nr:DUF2271 domain-containing protein [Colwellia demingiae]TWX71670.1 DUF2271 domain-containing protein [Colwellia demingiae]
MKITSKFYITILCGILFISQPSAKAANLLTHKLVVQIELTPFQTKHQNPYFSLWLTNENKEYKALVVLREKVKWLRDLKKFWRNIARENRNESDAVTSATSKKKQFNYSFEIESLWQDISLEVVRENGNRELVYFPLSTNKECVEGKVEIVKLCAQLIVNE